MKPLKPVSISHLEAPAQGLPSITGEASAAATQPPERVRQTPQTCLLPGSPWALPKCALAVLGGEWVGGFLPLSGSCVCVCVCSWAREGVSLPAKLGRGLSSSGRAGVPFPSGYWMSPSCLKHFLFSFPCRFPESEPKVCKTEAAGAFLVGGFPPPTHRPGRRRTN